MLGLGKARESDVAVLAGYVVDIASRARRCSATHDSIVDRTRVHVLVDVEGIPTGYVFCDRGLRQFWKNTSQFVRDLEPGWEVQTVDVQKDQWSPFERHDGTWTVAHDGASINDSSLPALGRADACLLARRLNAKGATPVSLRSVLTEQRSPTAVLHTVELMNPGLDDIGE